MNGREWEREKDAEREKSRGRKVGRERDGISGEIDDVRNVGRNERGSRCVSVRACIAFRSSRAKGSSAGERCVSACVCAAPINTRENPVGPLSRPASYRPRDTHFADPLHARGKLEPPVILAVWCADRFRIPLLGSRAAGRVHRWSVADGPLAAFTDARASLRLSGITERKGQCKLETVRGKRKKKKDLSC